MKALIVLLALALLSCASQKEIMDSWIGSTKHEVIMEWGPPEFFGSDGNGGQIIGYSKTGSGGYSTTSWIVTQYIYFYLKEGRVYHWNIRGEKDVYNNTAIIPVIRQ